MISQVNSGTSQKTSPYLRFAYKIVLKSVKNLNQIFWVTEFWQRAQKKPNSVSECKNIVLRKRRIPWIFLKKVSYIGVTYKPVFKSAKALIEMF